MKNILRRLALTSLLCGLTACGGVTEPGSGSGEGQGTGASSSSVREPDAGGSAGNNRESDDGSDETSDENLGGAGGKEEEAGQPRETDTKRECRSDSDCSDGIFCNGEASCRDGFCQELQNFQCDDGIECTRDSCDEAASRCVFQGPDRDGDGHIDAKCMNQDGEPLGDDCNDDDAKSYPGNLEICDIESRDEDCDPSTLGERDSDNDGYNDAACCNSRKDGKLSCGQDCDDHKAQVNPAANESCDFLDNNCNGTIDEGVSSMAYPDRDHDGHGDASAKAVEVCLPAVGYAEIADDCEDEDPDVFLGQFEICDGKDNNCDEGRKVDELQELAPWYIDSDDDGYGDPESTPIYSCYRPEGRVLSHNDCDDLNKKVNPNSVEICDAIDNDCNGKADFRLGGINDLEDDDGDGIADENCGGEDCNDEDRRTKPGAVEICDGVDNDCDGEIDEDSGVSAWYVDEDGDGWGVAMGSAVASCVPQAGRAIQLGDCDDTQNSIRPNATEYCDGIDQDCDGDIDEGASVHCILDNASSFCFEGGCVVSSCSSGFADEDGEPQNGCEQRVNDADSKTDVACTIDADCSDGNLCTGTESCEAGYCRLGTPINCQASDKILRGDIKIENEQDIEALGGVEFITGDLIIVETSLSSLAGLVALRSIGGSLLISRNSKMDDLLTDGLSNLEVVGGLIIFDNNPNIVEFKLPSLLSADGLEFTLTSNAKVRVVDFPSLVRVQNELRIISQAPKLEEILLAKLLRAGKVRIGHTAEENSLERVDISALDTVELSLSVLAEVAVSSNVSGLFLDELRTVGIWDTNDDGEADNNGAIELCTGILNGSTGGYDNASCDTIERMEVEWSYAGSAEDCGQCEEPE